MTVLGFLATGLSGDPPGNSCVGLLPARPSLELPFGEYPRGTGTEDASVSFRSGKTARLEQSWGWMQGYLTLPRQAHTEAPVSIHLTRD